MSKRNITYKNKKYILSYDEERVLESVYSETSKKFLKASNPTVKFLKNHALKIFLGWKVPGVINN